MSSPTNDPGPDNGPLGTFSVCLEFAGTQAVIAVGGDIDVVTAPELDAFVDAVIERNHRTVVMDMSDVDFIDAAGLRVLADGARRLSLVGGSLAVRSPSPMLRRMLELTGMTDLLSNEWAEEHARRLAAEQAVDLVNLAAHAPRPGLARHVRAVTSVPADEDVVDGALHLVTALAHATVDGAHGASVSLRRHGRLSTVAATDDTIADMDAGQYATGEGPCVDASVEGRWFHATALASEVRWPDFTPRARALGINAILSTPLMVGALPIGALNIYSRTADAFEPSGQELAALFAKEASRILANAGAAVTDARLSDRLQTALHDREVIAQAQGVLMHRFAVNEDDAYGRLRDEPSGTGRVLSLRAEDVLATVRPIDLSDAVSTHRQTRPLDLFRRDAGLTRGDLWLRYFDLGGMSTALQLEAILHEVIAPTAADHDVIALALNERFDEIQGGRPVPYFLHRSAS